MSHRVVLLTMGLSLAVGTVVTAEEGPTRQELLAMIQALKKRNELLEQRFADLEARVVQGAGGPELSRDQVRALVEKMMEESRDAMRPGWMENLTFSGDLRLRYQWRHRAAEQRDDDSRFRYRLRFGIVKTWPEDDLELGFRIVTGADDDPTSTNQTFEDMFEEHEIGIDRAYVEWTPRTAKGLTVIGGKMAQPWQTTDLVWDHDVNPGGVWVQYETPPIGPVTPWVGAGWFQLAYSDVNVPDTNLTAYEMGVRVPGPRSVVWTGSVALYNYTHINQAFATVPWFAANPSGNTVVGGRLNAGDFDLVAVTNAVTFEALRLPWKAYMEWVHNWANQDPADRSNGFAAGIKVGANKKKGDWSFKYAYKYIEADATLACFADSDFGGGSQTNRKGNTWKLTYNLRDNVTAGLTLYATEPIDTDMLAEFNKTRIDLRGDLVWNF